MSSSNDHIEMTVAPRPREAPDDRTQELEIIPATLESALEVMPQAVRDTVRPLLQLEAMYAAYMGDDPNSAAEPVWPRVTQLVQAGIAIDEALEKAGILFPRLLGGVLQAIEERNKARAEVGEITQELHALHQAYRELRRDASLRLTAAGRRIDSLEHANRGWRGEVDRLHEELNNRRWWRRRKRPETPAAD